MLADAACLPEAAATDRVGKVIRLDPGQPMSAKILEQLPDGKYKVLLAGRSLAMQLPTTLQPGQEVRLVYVGSDPHLTFSLAHDPGSSATVSSAGKLAAALTAAGQKPAASTVTAPLFETMPTQGNEIAPRLREALTLSGLFYESHQAQWVDGARPLNQLLREPQGRLSPLLSGDKGAVAAHLDMANPAVLEAAQLITEASLDSFSAHRANAIAAGPAHPDALPIIQQQLGTLESGQIIWQGQLWPGQFMDWKISEFGAEHAATKDQESTWETQLNLTLATLGCIDARLKFQRSGVAIRLQSDDVAVTSVLQSHSTELINALIAAGLSVSEIQVSSHAAA